MVIASAPVINPRLSVTISLHKAFKNICKHSILTFIIVEIKSHREVGERNIKRF
jgi:hypothetical protein